METIISILAYIVIAALLYSLTTTYLVPYLSRIIPINGRLIGAGLTVIEVLALKSPIDKYIVGPLTSLIA